MYTKKSPSFSEGLIKQACFVTVIKRLKLINGLETFNYLNIRYSLQALLKINLLLLDTWKELVIRFARNILFKNKKIFFP